MRSSGSSISFLRSVDWVLIWGLRGVATLVGMIVVLILVFLVSESLPFLRQAGVLALFTDPQWSPAQQLYQLTPMVISTLTLVAGAVLLATPIGVLAALFCQYYAPPPLATGFRRMLGLLAGVPGVVYGFWGLTVLVPLINRWHPPGTSLLAGILLVALLIIPTIALDTDALLTELPAEYLLGATALGLSRWGLIWGIAVPAARSGILTSVILGTGRAFGETMIVLMVCGNVVQAPSSLFDPIRTLPANIALEMDFALGEHRSALFVTGVVLMVATLGLVLMADAVAEDRR